MWHRVLLCLASVTLGVEGLAQSAVDVVRHEERQKTQRAIVKKEEKRAQQASVIEFRGQQAFKEKELRSQLKEEITTVEEYGLSPARADDLAFFLEVFYRKHGYAKVNVHYVIESQNRLRLDITEGPLMTLGKVIFDGNIKEPTDKLFEYVVGPTRERYSKLQKNLPFVAADMEEGAKLVHRLYVAEGFLDSAVDPPRYIFRDQSNQVDVIIPIHEGRQYFFGITSFSGRTIYDSETLRGQMSDLLQQPYTDARVADIPRRLEAYYKARGYYDVKVDATAAPDDAVNGRVPVQLDISAEEAKSKEFGLSIGYGTYEGGIVGVQFRDRDLFGYGRPLTTSIEVSQRGYKGEILYEDPFFFDTDFAFKARLAAIRFDFDGYSKFDLGGRLELTRKITKHDEAGLIFSVRHVKIISADIKPVFLGDQDYFVNTLGFTNTLDMRESPFVTPRGFLINNTLDLASSAFGSDIEFIRGTIRVGYYLPFGPKPLTPGVVEDKPGTPLQRWFQQSSIAFGARAGIIHSLTVSGPEEATAIPIDERFFNGGSDTVRSFGERDLGPHDNHGHPVGGEFFTVFNVEYTFPIYGELQGALFTDAGNLLPTSEDPGLNDMRYALGAGLRYKLPIGPIRLDYGVNPDPHPDEDFGAFHFSFGFAF